MFGCRSKPVFFDRKLIAIELGRKLIARHHKYICWLKVHSEILIKSIFVPIFADNVNKNRDFGFVRKFVKIWSSVGECSLKRHELLMPTVWDMESETMIVPLQCGNTESP